MEASVGSARGGSRCRERVRTQDFLAGVLFIARATAVTHAPSLDTVLGACLWFLACLSVIAGYR
jgi:hypothetical protein